MFNKKNYDPLVDSVKAVMEQNEFLRRVEAQVNEQFGVVSKNALPHELHAKYDAVLAEAKKCGMYEEDGKDSDSSGLQSAKYHHDMAVKAHKAMQKPGSDKKILATRKALHEKLYRRLTGKKVEYSGQNVNEAELSPKQKKLAKIGGHPGKIDKEDFDKLRANPSHAKKVGLEEKSHLNEELNNHEDMVTYHQNMADKHGKVGMNSDHSEAAKAHEKAANWHGLAQKSLDKNGAKSSEYKADAKKANMATTTAKEATRSAGGALAKQIKEEKSSDKAKSIISHEMKKFKAGDLHSGKKGPGKGPVVTNKKQAIAIALDVARRKGADVSPKKSKSKESEVMKEDIQSLLEEIRTNLEEELAYVFENYDEASFADYVNSLTEEQIAILGLDEGLGDDISGLASRAKAYGQEKIGDISQAAQNVAGWTTRKAGQAASAVGLRTTGQGLEKSAKSWEKSGAESEKAWTQAADRTLNAAKRAGTIDRNMQSYGQEDRAEARAARTPTSTATPSARTRETPSAPTARATRPSQPNVSQRTQPRKSPEGSERIARRTGLSGRPGETTSDIMNRAFAREETQHQIKESFEQFLRNRFLKG